MYKAAASAHIDIASKLKKAKAGYRSRWRQSAASFGEPELVSISDLKQIEKKVEK